jgi:dephospho-CoA kinase
VLSTDQVVHELYASDEVKDAVRERFGAEVIRDDEVDRHALAEKIFAGDGDRQWVEGLLWPRVDRRMLAWREEVDGREPRPRAAVVEVPLLFEAGIEGAFDTTIAVVADEAVRSHRAGARGHAAVAERTARQLSQDEKAARAQHVVVNNGTTEELERALSGVLDILGR